MFFILTSMFFTTMVSFTFTAFHSWQFMYIIIISTLLNSFSFHSRLKTYLLQVFPTIDFWYLISGRPRLLGLKPLFGLLPMLIGFLFSYHFISF